MYIYALATPEATVPMPTCPTSFTDTYIKEKESEPPARRARGAPQTGKRGRDSRYM